MDQQPDHPPIGIDLGTTFSAVAYLDASGKPETIRNSEGDLTTPSAVFFDYQRPIVGVEAIEAGLIEPDRLAQFVKRNVGEGFYEKTIGGKRLPAEVLQALVLRKLKSDAELKLGEIRQAVITVPAYFNEPCRKATQDAGRMAGLHVLDIINEPTAAAITYGVEQGFLSSSGKNGKPETVLVYDLGGGTFDVTVMRIEGARFETIATAGDVYLGGVDWDARIVDFIGESFAAEHGVDPREDPQAEQELLRKANQAKHALTQREATTIAFSHRGRRMRTELTQAEFVRRCEDLIERTIMTVQLVLDDAAITWGDLTRLILVGGSTRMPMIRDELERLSGMKLDRSLSPDEAVCHGAALYAGMLQASDERGIGGISVRNVNSHDLGVLAVDPSTGKPRRRIMIPRNSPLPAKKGVKFKTHTDNQSNVKIDLVEGGDDRGINATFIGKCIVDDLPKGIPKGTRVLVQFDYSADGRFTVYASLPDADRKITMTLDRASGLSEKDIQTWMQRLDDGMSDAMLATLETEETSQTDASPSEPDGELSFEQPASRAGQPAERGAERTLAAAPTDDKTSEKPGVDDGAERGDRAGPEQEAAAVPIETLPIETPPIETLSIEIDTGDSKKRPASVSPADAAALANTLGTPPVPLEQKPNLQLEDEQASEPVRPDADDWAALASLGGDADSEKPQRRGDRSTPAGATELPKINTDAAKKETKSKRGGLFGRKRK
jgi:molecular chaperone DnaK